MVDSRAAVRYDTKLRLRYQKRQSELPYSVLRARFGRQSSLSVLSICLARVGVGVRLAGVNIFKRPNFRDTLGIGIER